MRCEFYRKENNMNVGKLKGKIVEKGTMCKMARGEMVRYMAENEITEPEQLKCFDRLGYGFCSEYSDGNNFVFIKNATKS